MEKERYNMSEFILQTRKKLNLSRKNLALILNVSEPTIVRWEGAQKGNEASNIDAHNLQLLKTLNWLFDEVNKEKCDLRLKYIYSLILGTTESKKAINFMKSLGFSWIAVSLVGARSLAPIPIELIFKNNLINPFVINILALNKKNNEKLFKNLKKFSATYGAKGLLYVASMIKEGFIIK